MDRLKVECTNCGSMDKYCVYLDDLQVKIYFSRLNLALYIYKKAIINKIYSIVMMYKFSTLFLSMWVHLLVG